MGAEEFVVAVPPGRCEEPVCTYTTFNSGVHALRDWLFECGIKTVAMESTGNYWITLYAKPSRRAMKNSANWQPGWNAKCPLRCRKPPKPNVI